MTKTKLRFGDRVDGALIRDLDAMHFVMGTLYPNRCDNEAFIAERIDLTPINAYLEKKNAEGDDFKYTFLHVIIAALMRTVALRPKLNRFIVNGNYYQRYQRTASFVIKKQFSDKSEEGLAKICAGDNDTLDTIHAEIKRQVTDVRGGKSDSTDKSMNIFNKMPHFLSKALIRFVCRLDRHGWVPQSMVATDPAYSTVLLSNLGSIKLCSGYHHLTNWGTCSLFCVVGEKKATATHTLDGKTEIRETLDLGLTIDERLADGYYYSKSIRLLKYLLAHPEELEKPMTEEVDYE